MADGVDGRPDGPGPEGGIAADLGAMDLGLDALDITTEEVDFAGLREELDRVGRHEIIDEILTKNNCDIKRYAKDVEAKLRLVEAESIEGYVNESDKLSDLNDKIHSCDDVLGQMEEMLGRFQSDLGSISSEIRQIQGQSMSLNVKLKNRKALHERLSRFAEEMFIPPAVIDTIVESEVDANYLPCLTLLSRKLDYIRTSQDAKASAAYQDVAPELARLETKAISKVRSFLLEQIGVLRKPKTNIQIIQQNKLLKLKGFVSFLRKQSAIAHKEIRSYYCETVGKTLLSHFRVYLSHCQNLEMKHAQCSDVIGLLGPNITKQAVGSSSIFSSFAVGGSATRSRSGDPVDVFRLRDRHKIMDNLDKRSPIVPHVAESQNLKFPTEAIFRSMCKLLMDSCSSEYVFVSEFFTSDSREVFFETMDPALEVIREYVREMVASCFDPIALLIMVRVNRQHQLVMQKRRVPCLDRFLDEMNMVIWPRLKVILDNQHVSLRNVAQKLSSSRGGGGDAKMLREIARKYSELNLSLVHLNLGFNQGQLQHSLERLRSTMENLLLGSARQMQPVSKSAAFLVNQYSLIVNVLKDGLSGVVSGDDMDADAGAGADGDGSTQQSSSSFGQRMIDHFDDLCASNISLYVEQELSRFFGEMVDFVKGAEQESRAMGSPSSQPQSPNFGVAAAAQIMRDFSAKWKLSIDQIHNEVSQNFLDGAECGKGVLKAILTQLLLYYTRFVEVLKEMGPAANDVLKESVTIPSIMYEIKKFK